MPPDPLKDSTETNLETTSSSSIKGKKNYFNSLTSMPPPAPSSSPFRFPDASHILTVPSRPPDAKNVPSWLKPKLDTDSS
jgi:hypothetical protein